MIDYLSANWPWILLVGAMVAMHTRHGGCGSHHGQDHSGHDHPAEQEAPRRGGS